MDFSKAINKRETSNMPSAIQSNQNQVSKDTVDELKHQIFQLTSELSLERSRNRERHHEAVVELKRTKHELEKQKGEANLIRQSLGSEDLHAAPQLRMGFKNDAAYTPHHRTAASRKDVMYGASYSAGPPFRLDYRPRRSISSMSQYSTDNPYIAVITNLQREIGLLRESKKDLEQRLVSPVVDSTWIQSVDERGCIPSSDLSFVPFDRSYDDFELAAESGEECPSITASLHSVKQQVSDKLDSTFVIEPDGEENLVELLPPAQLDQSTSSAQSERGFVKESKCDRDVKESEKHWQLQKKVTDLSAQSAQLEKRITALKEENEVLKKKTEEQRVTDEKTKKLKRRNAELATIARRLEEKVKQLQQDNHKKVISTSPGVEVNGMKQTTPKTKTKERTPERVKTSATNKDKERMIASMREKFQELLRLNQSVQENEPTNKEFYTEQVELENIVKVSANERLKLEKKLVDAQHNPDIEAQRTKAIHLERRNAELTDEVERLTKFADERERLEIELMQRRIEVETLEKQVFESERRCAQLAEELQELIIKNTQLTIINTDITKQIGELEQMAKDYSSLSASLAEAKSESEKAKSEAVTVRERVQTLEAELQYLGQVEKKKCQLEQEKNSLQEALRVKDLDLERFRKEQDLENSRHEQSVKQLELRLNEVEGLYKQELLVSENLRKELRDLHQTVGKNPALTSSEAQREQPATEARLMHSSPISVTSVITGSKPDVLDVANGVVDCESEPEEILHDRNESDSIIQVYQAMYSYDPDQCSPNDEPEVELLLVAGDYLFVYGKMDEDGFYTAELLDGRQGLVPSNFVRRLSEGELAKFYSDINLDVHGNEGPIQSDGNQVFLDFSGNEDTGIFGERKLSSVTAENTCKQLDTSADNLDFRLQGVPDAPVNVQVESGPDHGCLMVSWLPVTITATGTSNGALVAGYDIYVDGNKVKCLSNPTGDHILLEVEDLTSNVEPRVITVRTVATSGAESGDSVSALIPPHLLRELKTIRVQDNNEVDVQPKAEVEHDVLRDAVVQDGGSERLSSSPDSQLLIRLDCVVATKTPDDFHERSEVDRRVSFPEKVLHYSDARDSENFPLIQKQTSLEMVAVNHDDTDEALSGAFAGSVWKKVGKKPSKMDASDLTSADLDLKGRTWKSLDSGDSKSVVVKTQSQELLGGVRRSDMLRYSSQTNVYGNGNSVEERLLENGITDEEEDEEEEEDDTGVVVDPTTVPYERLQSFSENSEPLQRLTRKNVSPAKSIPRTDYMDSAFSEFTSSLVDHRNGFVRNSDVDDISSSSELADNNAVTSKKIRDDIPDSELIDYSDDGGESLVESTDGERNSHVRVFIALFSYDPEMMSPNPDAATEELPFREGQIIKIYGEKDQDGFFLGEINHQRGLVPCNMISEVHFNDPDIAAQLLEESHRPTSQSAGSSRTSSRTSDFTSRTHSTVSLMGVPDDERLSPVGEPNPENIPERYVVALYNYDPHELSPNNDVDEELSFQKGDIMKVFGGVDDDGFYYGQLDNRMGLIPSNFVKEAPSVSAVRHRVALHNR